ncbi:cysteine desulfurase/selenocysteine lyase [Mycoplasma testudineum]|uniref:Cysteine desulfurase/selenocysteine lyase n=1 Tax=Mycoplasma testudineum TaxID=244584 RepID=A0A4R6IDM3_9MOLU|nr:aminotransferase class V-fold PLP-dependent enzyme [Mycoplasma testudineum]OYD26667.1 aminotransferase class V [Mycoplasma testudineum]TDO19796.1 cysteine desulfurase/selenocysteine lyase [Mycoplasma testudineum]
MNQIKSKNDLRKLFPMASKIIYFDNAAAALKPKNVIEETSNYYLNLGISNRTIETEIGFRVQEKIDLLRKKILNLVGVSQKSHSVIFTSGTTESLNLISEMISKLLTPNDEVIISNSNHASNIIPWVYNSKKLGFKIISSSTIVDQISDKTKVISIGQQTNNFENEFDFFELVNICKKRKIILINDAAQAIIHGTVSANDSTALAFSANKLYGPTGLGFLVVENNFLSNLTPSKYGGGTVKDMWNNSAINFDLITDYRAFEPGTLNIAGIFGMVAAMEFFESIDHKHFLTEMEDISNYIFENLSKLENWNVYRSKSKAIIMASLKGVHSQDIATYLGKRNIYVRHGKFCAHLNFLNQEDSFIRISLGIYNTMEEAKILIETLKKGGDFFEY